LAELLYELSPEALRTGNADLNGILAAHKNVVPDIPTDEFVSAYQDAVMYLSQNCKGTLTKLQQVFKVTAANENWSPVTLAIARIIAAKPHSCDVERLVSAYNQLKDTNRCKMSAETIDTYLNIRVNMPPLAEFDVRPAVRRWMADKERRERIPVKATKQAWFKGTFREALRQTMN